MGAPDRSGSVILLGDSHAIAIAIATALDAALTRENMAGYVVHTDCFPIAGLFDSRQSLTPERRSYCAEANRRLREFVSQSAVTDIAIAIRCTTRLYPMDGDIDAPGFDNHEGGVEDVPYRQSGVFEVNGQWTDAAVPKAEALRAYIIETCINSLQLVSHCVVQHDR
jgi:hypothetical protein